MAKRTALKPTDPTPIDKYTARALRGMYSGEGVDPGMQRHAIEWIVKRVANVGGSSMTPGMPDMTGFLEGRRFVGLQIVNAIEAKISDLPEKVTDE